MCIRDSLGAGEKFNLVFEPSVVIVAADPEMGSVRLCDAGMQMCIRDRALCGSPSFAGTVGAGDGAAV